MLTCQLEGDKPLAFIACDEAQTRARRSTAYPAIAARGTETAPLQLLVQTQIR
jgi:hypothetical protein